MSRAQRALLGIGGALLSAALVVLAFPKWNLFFLAYPALAVLLLAVRGLSNRRVFLLGWLMGVATNVGGFYWISHTLTEFAFLHPLLGALGVLLNAMYTGLQYALWAWLTVRLCKSSGLGAVAVGPPVFAVLDLLFPMMFPWYIGNSQYNFLPAAQVAELCGIIGVSFLVVLVGCGIHDSVERYRRRAERFWLPAAVALGVWLVAVLGGWARMAHIDSQVEHADKLKVGVVQVNINHWDKINRNKFRANLKKFLDLSQGLVDSETVDLLLWPETAITFFVDLANMESPVWARELDKPLMTGGLSCQGLSCRTWERPHYNSSFLFLPGGKIGGVYHKNYPMLFSEYIPFGEQMPFVYRWIPHAGNFSRGEFTTAFEIGGWRLGPMICYEDILPRFGLELVEHAPHVFINQTNDSWFGDSAEPYQHMALSVFRSIEHRRPLVRSTNTGISCFIDPVGRIRKTTNLFSTETLVDEMPKLETLTLYSVLGDWLAFGSMAFCVALVIRGRRRKRAERRGKKER